MDPSGPPMAVWAPEKKSAGVLAPLYGPEFENWFSPHLSNSDSNSDSSFPPDPARVKTRYKFEPNRESNVEPNGGFHVEPNRADNALTTGFRKGDD